MKKLLVVLNVLLLGVFLVAVPVRAQDEPSLPDDAAVLVGEEPFSPEELDNLLAPIALYPDPLIAQILPAATFVDQIDAAARYVRLYGSAARIDEQPWDVSVRAVAYYPEVLYMMDRKYDWTVALGQAYLNQPDEVMEAIQRLRYRAQEMGNLSSTPQQTVVAEEGYLSIIPAQPSVIYVPVYDPLLVYWERPYPDYGFISFGVGFTIGVWLNRDCDWHRHRIYYHGWKGRGWVDRARSHVNARNRVYVGDRLANVTVNHRVRRYDTRQYRNVIRRDVQFRRERGGWTPSPDRRERGRETRGTRGGTAPPTAPARDSGAPHRQRDRREQPPPVRGGLPPIPSGSRGTVPPLPRPQEHREQPKSEQRQPAVRVPQPTPSSPSPSPATPPSHQPPERVPQQPAGGAPQPTRPDRGERYRGRDTGVSAPAPSSGYGGYGNRRELPDYRERGQRSREQMQRIAPQPTAPVRPAAPSPAARPAPSPASRSGFSGSRPSAPPPGQQQNRPAVRGGGTGHGGQRGDGRRNR